VEEEGVEHLLVVRLLQEELVVELVEVMDQIQFLPELLIQVVEVVEQDQVVVQ
tara:strand:+ start:334 stop:492 length:159 start_codon:yes stop_codon:yes gene_type:complete